MSAEQVIAERLCTGKADDDQGSPGRQVPTVPLFGRGNGVLPDRSDSVRIREQPQLDGRDEMLKEHAWLPALAPHLPLPVPVPQRLGEPSERFPRPWIVTTWVPGTPADRAPATRAAEAADALAAFLTALHRPAPDGAPAGRGSGGPLVDRSERFADSSASADCVAQGTRTARSSPSRHSLLSQPRAPSLTGRSARSGCWSRSRSRTNSAVISISVWVMRSHGSRTATRRLRRAVSRLIRSCRDRAVDL